MHVHQIKPADFTQSLFGMGFTTRYTATVETHTERKPTGIKVCVKVLSLILVNGAWVDIHEIWRKYAFEIATAHSSHSPSASRFEEIFEGYGRHSYKYDGHTARAVPLCT